MSYAVIAEEHPTVPLSVHPTEAEAHAARLWVWRRDAVFGACRLQVQVSAIDSEQAPHGFGLMQGGQSGKVLARVPIMRGGRQR